MFKKIIAVLLTAALVLSLAACGKKEKEPTEPIEAPTKKVAVLVAPEAQYPEDYKAAAELAAAYPEAVTVREYADSRILKAGNPEIMQLSEELAKDSSIGAIIYARATQYTSLAITAAKKINPDLVTACIEPEDSVDTLSQLSNVVFCADWNKAAQDIISTAKEAGAEYFVMFSFNRHITDNPFHAAERSYFEKACKDSGINFVYDNAVDPTFSGGIEKSQLYIKESVARLINNGNISGSNVVLFSTDSAVQSTLVSVADEKGFIYVCPSFPTAYNGVSEVCKADYPEKIADVATFIKSLKAAVPTEGTGRLYAYSYPLASTLLSSAVYTVYDILNGKTTADNLAERTAMRATDAAGDEGFTIAAYQDYGNVFAAYRPGFEKLR